MLKFWVKDYAEERVKIREIENPRSPEFFVRVFGVCIPAAMGYWLADIHIFLPWYIAILATVAIAQIINRLTWHSGSFGGFVLSLIGGGLQASAVAYLPWWFWMQPDTVLNFFGLLIIVGGLIHIFIQRATIVAMLAVTSAPFFLVLVIIAGSLTPDNLAARLTAWTGIAILAFYTALAIARRETERLEYERAMRSISEADRLTAIARLTGGVAHDFNNLLSVIIGNLQLHEEIKDPLERKVFITEAQAAANRGADLVAQLLRFARKSPTHETIVELGAVVETIIGSARRLIPPGIKVVMDRPDSPVFARIDQLQLEASLLNLIVNSIQAMGTHGTIELGVRLPDASTDMAGIHVVDTGPGIDPEHLAKVTEPFFTTKPIGEGTGLGLSSVQGFIVQSGGRLDIQNAQPPATGAIVTLYVPVIPAPT